MKVSVLVATKDRPRLLVRAINALVRQQFDGDLEILVADGGTDHACLDAYESVIVVPREGTTIAEGFADASLYASGDVWHHACDDDVMLPGTIQSALDALADPAMGGPGWPFYDQPQWTYGMLRFDDGTEQEYPEPWDPEHMMEVNTVHQPTVFYRREMFDKLGPFNTDFPYCWDYEWWGRLGAYSAPVVRAHYDALYSFWPGSTSMTMPEVVEADAERVRAMWRKYGFGQRPDDKEVMA